ncbi:MAG: NAD(P)-dependent alcohol dehydrogenase [bacterium]|nr:NAD(P)-dependent alcohol dehydrogenase [bacterium]
MTAQKMNAIISTAYGSADVLKLQQVDIPVPKQDEVLIKVHATTVTNAHTAMRTGYPLFGRLFMGLMKPKMEISGTDFSGEIVATGAKVNKYHTGDLVFGSTDLNGGSYAEYLTIKENEVFTLKPENYTHAQATAIIDGASTAYAFLKNAIDLKAGQKILINGASGSIGTAAVQLAKFFGAEVTGVCSTSNVLIVKSLGADYVIDYAKTDFTKGSKKYDVIFDTVGKSSFKACKGVLEKDGTYLTPVLTLGSLKDMLKSKLFSSKKAVFMASGLRDSKTKSKEFIAIKKLIENNKLTPVIDRYYQLPQIPEAHRYVEKGHKKGNVVISIVEGVES